MRNPWTESYWGMVWKMCLGWILAAVVEPSLIAAEGLLPKNFAELHGLIKPRAEEEKWARIPWRTSLWEARQEAARLGKPILLWEMDGHPLGCT